MTINFKLVNKDAIIPEKNNNSDAGIDFFACEDMDIFPHTTKLVKTGTVWEPTGIPDEFNVFMDIRDRSGNVIKKGFHLLAGIVDEDYRGEIMIAVHNIESNGLVKIKKGDKIAQGIIHLIPKINCQKVEITGTTIRGEKGWGSSGG